MLIVPNGVARFNEFVEFCISLPFLTLILDLELEFYSLSYKIPAFVLVKNSSFLKTIR